jgi:hypothetical protein
MGILPSSPRRRRRTLAALLALTVLAAATVAAIVLNKPVHEPALVEGPVATPQTEREQALTPADRREINAMLTRFVHTAVTRRDPNASWSLATPALRNGTSRAEWRDGNIPVYEYRTPLKKVAIWNYALTARNDVLGNVILTPPKGADVGPIDFSVEVRKLGGKWRVESFYPEQIYPASMTAAAPKHPPTARSIPTAAERLAARKAADSSGLNEKPLFAFLGILIGLIFFIPAGVALRDWAQTRWQDRGVSRRPLPPLPEQKR